MQQNMEEVEEIEAFKEFLRMKRKLKKQLSISTEKT